MQCLMLSASGHWEEMGCKKKKNFRGSPQTKKLPDLSERVRRYVQAVTD